MNKILSFSILACGLLLLDVPEAVAHKEVRNRELPPSYQRGFRDDHGGYHRYRRHDYWGKSYRDKDYWDKRHHSKQRHYKKMPKWLKRDRGFQRWYRYSEYGRDRRLSWSTLFEIYQWQRAHRRYYYRF